MTETASSGMAERVGLLTPKERDIVVLIGQGLKNREIAERLGSAEKTIKGHLTTIFYKLGVQDRLALALLAVKIHLAPPEPLSQDPLGKAALPTLQWGKPAVSSAL